MDKIARIIDHGIDFDPLLISKDILKGKLVELFEGEGFQADQDKESLLLIKEDLPVCRIYIDNTGLSFQFFDVIRAFQVIMLTCHGLKSYREVTEIIREDIESLRSEGILVFPTIIEE